MRVASALIVIIIAVIGGCAPLAVEKPQPRATAQASVSRFEATNPPLPTVQQRAEESPVNTAARFLAANQARLSQVSQDPQFNGYQDLVGLKRREDGLLQLHEVRLKSGEGAFGQKIDRWLSKKDSPLGEDVKAIKVALGKPLVTAHLTVKENGPVVVDLDKDFTRVVTALDTLCYVYDRFPDSDDRLMGYLLVLDMGRKLSFNAAVWSHYRLGMALQQAALGRVSALLRAKDADLALTRAAIPRLQAEVGGPQELLPVLDNEYLVATRGLELSTPDIDRRQAEATRLASSYLQARESSLTEEPPEKGYYQPDSSHKGEPALNYMKCLGQSREAATQLAAVELIAALETHRLETGSYPLKLEQLIPGVITRIPTDSLSSGGKFTYQSDGKSYTLTSLLAGSGAKTISW